MSKKTLIKNNYKIGKSWEKALQKALQKVLVLSLVISLGIMPGSLGWLDGSSSWSLAPAKSEAALAMMASERLGTNFSDFSDSHWAARQIRELQMRGILMGFADGTFRADKGLKKIEGLVMAVRILGLDFQASQKVYGDYHDLNVYDALGLSWAKGYLEVAFEQGLITRYSEEPDWYGDADRLWMARLFTRVLDKEKEAQAHNNKDSYYKDMDQVPTAMRGYVYLMFAENLMEGYPDQTFRPYAPITRAEIAALFVKYLDKYVRDYSYDKLTNLTVEEYDPIRERLILRNSGHELETYRLHRNTMVWNREGQTPVRQTASHLKAGARVRLAVYGDFALMIDIVGQGYSTPDSNIGQNVLPNQDVSYRDAGHLRVLSEQIPFVGFDNVFGGKGNYYLADNLVIYDGVRRLTRDDLRRDQLYIYEVEHGRIVRMDEVPGYDDSYRGVVVTYSNYTDALTLRLNNGELVTLDVPESLGEGLHLNDMILARSYDGMMISMDILSYSYIEGWFESYDKRRQQLTVRDLDRIKYTFKVSDDVRLSVPGDAYAKLENLKRDHYLQLSFAYLPPDDRGREADIVVNVYVLTSVKEDTSEILSQGTVYDLQGTDLLMDAWFGSKDIYQLTDKTVIKAGGKELDEFGRARLVPGQDITFYHKEDRLTEINLVTNGTFEGHFTGYSSEGRIWITDDKTYRLEFRLADDLFESFGRDNNAGLANLLGEYVNVVVSQDQVTNLQTNYLGTNLIRDAKIWTYDQGQNLLWVKEDGLYYIYRLHPDFFVAGYGLERKSIPQLHKLAQGAWERVDIGVVNGVVITIR